jgi:hypothetical protein
MIQISRRLRSGIAVLTLISVQSTPFAQSGTNVPTAIADLEYRLEISRHERFLKMRRSTGDALDPFTSDGCSGGLSIGWTFAASKFPALAQHHGKIPPWEKCCVAHDKLYHVGGSSALDATASFEARRAADDQLRECVINAGMERIKTLESEYGLSRTQIETIYRSIAAVMYRAVRLGGIPCTDLPWRWGFGWPPCE